MKVGISTVKPLNVGLELAQTLLQANPRLDLKLLQPPPPQHPTTNHYLLAFAHQLACEVASEDEAAVVLVCGTLADVVVRPYKSCLSMFAPLAEFVRTKWMSTYDIVLFDGYSQTLAEWYSGLKNVMTKDGGVQCLLSKKL